MDDPYSLGEHDFQGQNCQERLYCFHRTQVEDLFVVLEESMLDLDFQSTNACLLAPSDCNSDRKFVRQHEVTVVHVAVALNS